MLRACYSNSCGKRGGGETESHQHFQLSIFGTPISHEYYKKEILEINHLEASEVSLQSALLLLQILEHGLQVSGVQQHDYQVTMR
jgi:hypothetical protein